MTFARTLMMTLVSLLTITAAQTVEADSDGYPDRGKSSPKIAHRMRTGDGTVRFLSPGMYRDRGKSSPKIAERTLQSQRNLILDEIEMAFELGELELANQLLDDLPTHVWEGGGGWN